MVLFIKAIEGKSHELALSFGEFWTYFQGMQSCKIGSTKIDSNARIGTIVKRYEFFEELKRQRNDWHGYCLNVNV